MKIKSVVASDFGCLSGRYVFSDDRANIVVESNERGKSTLVAAILAGLYDFPPSRERKTLPEKEAFQPWNGGPFRVELEVEDREGRPLRIERDFDKRTVRITDLSTNKDVSEEFRTGKRDFAIGEQLLGLSREVFVKTCLVRQLDIENVGESSELAGKVQQIFDTSGGKGTTAEAINVLEETLRKHPGSQLKVPGMIETESERLKEAIAEREQRIRELTAERERAAPSMNRLRNLRRRLEELEVSRRQLEILIAKAEINEIRDALSQDAKNRGELDRLVNRRESLRQYSEFTKDKASEFARLVGRLEELRKSRGQLEAALGKVEKNLEAAKEKERESAGFGELDDAFKTHLHDLAVELRRLTSEAQRARDELSRFEESIHADGLDPREMDRISQAFSSLSVEETDFLRDSEARRFQIPAEVGELDARQQRLGALAKRSKVLVPLGVVLLLAVQLALVFKLEVHIYAIGMVLVAAGFAAAKYFERGALRRLAIANVKELRREAKDAEAKRQELLAEQDELSRKLEELARKTQSETVDILAGTFKRWGRLDGRARRLETFRANAQTAGEKLASCKEKGSEELRRLGVEIPAADLTPDDLQSAERKVADYLDVVSSIKSIAEIREATLAEITNLRTEEESIETSLRGTLKAASLPEDLALEEAQPKVEDAQERCEEFRRLDAREIPEIEKKLLSSEKREEKEKRISDLSMQVEATIARDPELSSLEATESRSEYEQQAMKVAGERTETTEEKSTIWHEVVSVEETYRKEYPRLANDVADLKDTLERTERFQEAVSLAIETLRTISERSHEAWGAVLNDRANEILRHFNPRCRELTFDRDMSFTVIPKENARPQDQKHIEAQESVGARQQIYLAVRLALSDYLSSEESRMGKEGSPSESEGGHSGDGGQGLPIVLDDPFATSDDDRFLSGMKFLCRRYRKNHQVILLTCHRERHCDFLQREAPGLSEDIRILDLQQPAAKEE